MEQSQFFIEIDTSSFLNDDAVSLKSVEIFYLAYFLILFIINLQSTSSTDDSITCM